MAKNYLSNKEIQIWSGTSNPGSEGVTGPTGSIYSNLSDGSIWSQTTGSTSGWVQLGSGGGTSIYTGDGQLTSDRTIDTDGNGIVIHDSNSGAYLDMHTFKGSAGWSVGTTFSSLTVDWCGGGTNADFGQLYAGNAINLKVGEPGSGPGSECSLLVINPESLLWSAAGPTTHSSGGGDPYSGMRMDVNIGMTFGESDFTNFYLLTNGDYFNLNGAVTFTQGNLPNSQWFGNSLWVNSPLNSSGGYTGEWGPNYQGTLCCNLWAQTTDATPTIATLFSTIPSNDKDGIPLHVGNNITEYRFGQYEFNINMITEDGNLTTWVINGAFKTINGAATIIGTPSKMIVCDENGASADVDPIIGSVVSFTAHLGVQVTGIVGLKCIWAITCKVNGGFHPTDEF